MLKILKVVFRRCKSFLGNSNLVSKLIRVQHRLWPMPLAMFDVIFRSGLRRRLFDFYGANIAKYSYLRRGSDQLGYWLSRESLYWHFWRQTDTNDKIFDEILSLEPVKNLLSDEGGLTAVEIGFGLGKNYAKFLRQNNFKKYIAVEPNVYLCNYVAKRFLSDKNFEVVNASVADFTSQERGFDILVCSGGVFMYLDSQTVNRFFQSLMGAGVKTVIILNEGTTENDIYRDDGTTMYNFKKRLLASGYNNKDFIEKQKEDRVYSYFIMC